MEGHVPTSLSAHREATTAPSENAGPTPIPTLNVGRPGDVNGPATTPQTQPGVKWYSIGGTSSLPLQGQVPV